MLTRQSLHFKKTQYERPTAAKICGRSLFGEPCVLGPNKEGLCQTEHECIPRNQGNRWLCTRAESAGGKCSLGPSADGCCRHSVIKCAPITNLRYRRGRVVALFTALCFAMLTWVLATPSARIAFIDPGELSSHHGNQAKQCDNCHSAMGQGLMVWIESAWLPHPVDAENKRCQNCHDMGNHANKPHGLPPQVLEARTLALNSPQHRPLEKSFNLFQSAETDHLERGLACATCHQEHKNKQHDLTVLSKDQCEFCHVNQHPDFQTQHPTFTNYPYARRTRLNFDHVSHFYDHFTKQEFAVIAPTQCRTCHQLDSKGETVLTERFENTCIGCHSHQVSGESQVGEKGISVFHIPGMDVDTLTENDIRIGQWPEDADADELTPIMRYMLSGLPEVAPHLPVLDALELTDLSDANPSQLQSVEKVAWGVKHLLHHIIGAGHEALQRLLNEASGQALQTPNSKAATALLPKVLLIRAKDSWFPSLDDEIRLWQQGLPPVSEFVSALDEITENTLTEDDWVKSGGWYQKYTTVYYRPTGHRDAFLKAWLTRILPDTRQPHPTPLASKVFQQLSGKDSPGQCLKCHSIDESEQEVRLNWYTARPVREQQQFTRFNHRDHFTLLSNKGCLTCHRFDPKADYLAGFDDRNPNRFSSNFHTIEKAVCAQCHTPKDAGDNCLQCHNYHIGHLASPFAIDQIPGTRQ